MPPNQLSTRFDRNDCVPLVAFLLYAGLLCVLLPLQSLWVDELMQTSASRYLPLSTLLGQEIRHTAGQVPLAYLVQKLSISLLGYSTFSARLPAALMGVLACFGVYQLAKQAGIRHSWLCVGLFATLPLQLRYATEARPYSQALCIAVWLTVIFLKLRARQTRTLFWAYTTLCVAGLYTQPFTLFIMAAHGAYALIESCKVKRFGLLTYVVAAAGLSAVLFLPWYVFAKAGWKADVNASNLHFHMHAKLPLEIVRELTGGGYVDTLLIVLLSVYALRWSSVSSLDKWFWALLAIVPGALALFVDAAFDYFFAIRQIIFVLPPLMVLTALGLEAIDRNGRPRLATLLAIVLLALNIGYSVRWYTRPREDWGAAAVALDRARSAGACLVFLPAASVRYYEFYVPGLGGAACNLTNLENANSVFAASSPYFRDPASENALRGRLQSQGFVLASFDEVQEPRVSIFRRQK